MQVNEVVEITQKAIAEHKPLLIDYVSKDFSITKDRLIEPNEIHYSTDGEPEFVWGHCYLRNDLRRFQFEGIQKIKPMEWNEAWDFLIEAGKKEKEKENDKAVK